MSGESPPPHPNPRQLAVLPRLRGRGGRIALAAIALLSIALRFANLARESLWFDEGWTWWLTSLPTGEMFRVIRGDVVAPAYFYLLRGWTLAFGDGAVALRSLSALLSTLAIVPFAWILWHGPPARDSSKNDHGPEARATGRTASMMVGLALLAVATMQVQLARDARPYALLVLASLGALACVPTLAHRRSPRAVAGFVACVVVGLYTHNMMAFTAVGLAGAWLAWPGGRTFRGRCADLGVAVPCIALIYAPWLPVMREQARWIAGKFWATHPDGPALAIALSNIVGVDPYAIPAVAWERFAMAVGATEVAVAVCTMVAASIGLALAARDAWLRRAALAIASVALVPPALVYAYSAVAEPVFVARVFIASGAAVPLLVALPLAAGRAIGVRIAGASLALGLFALMSLSTIALLGTPQKEDWRGAYEAVRALPESERRLLVFVATEGELPFAFYAKHDAARRPETRTGAPGAFLDADPPRTIRRVLSDADVAPLRAELASGRWEEVVLVLGHDEFSDPDGRTKAVLRATWRCVDERSLRHVRVLRFVGN